MPIQLRYAPGQRRSVVEFSNGEPKEDARFECKVYKRAGDDERRVMTMTTKHMKYAGNSLERRDRHPYARKYVVAELDPRTGVAQIFDTDYYSLAPLLPQVVDAAGREEHQAKLVEQLAAKDERSFGQKQDDLTEVFGSKNKKRAMASRMRNQGAENTAAIESTVATLLEANDSAVFDNPVASQQATDIIPCNRDAESLQEVYPLPDLFPQAVSRSVIDLARQFLTPAAATVQQWQDTDAAIGSRWVVSHAKNPPREAVENPQYYEEYTCCLQLMTYLIRIYHMRASDCRKPSLFEREPEVVRNWLLSEFFLGEGKNRKFPNRMKDKVLAYALVLAWNVDGFRTDADHLKQAFAVSHKKLQAHARALGGAVKSSQALGEKRQHVVLSLPLSFPVQHSRSGASRR